MLAKPRADRPAALLGEHLGDGKTDLLGDLVVGLETASCGALGANGGTVRFRHTRLFDRRVFWIVGSGYTRAALGLSLKRLFFPLVFQ